MIEVNSRYVGKGISKCCTMFDFVVVKSRMLMGDENRFVSDRKRL